MLHPTGQCSRAIHFALALLALLPACQQSGRLDRGDLLLSEGKAAEAIEEWNRALADRPGDVGLLTRIATAQTRLGRLSEAEATMLRAAAVEPKSAKVRQNLALVYLKARQFDKALDAFQQVLDIEPGYPETCYFIGLIHEMQGDEAAAVKCYVRDVNTGPSRAWERLQAFKERQRQMGVGPREPDPDTMLILSGVVLGLAAVVYAVRIFLERHQGEPPTHPGS